MRLAMERVVTNLRDKWTHVRQRIRLYLINRLADWISSLEVLQDHLEAGLPRYNRNSRPYVNRHSRLVRR